MNLSYTLTFDDKIPFSAQKAIENVFENFAFFCKYNQLDFSQNISIGLNGKSKNYDCLISQKFINLLENKIWSWQDWFENDALLIDGGFEDYLGTCFYMINCIQEYADDVEDKWNRFDYKKSYQSHFGVVDENLVVEHFKLIAEKLNIKNNFKAPSTVFLSHDIDILNVKRQSISTEWRTFNISAILRNLAKNKFDFLEDLITIEKNLGIKATYFWLTEQGDIENIPHADYEIKEVQPFIEHLKAHPNFKNGLHKSTYSKSLEEEASTIGENIQFNRYHFLKYNVKVDYEKLEQSNIQADCSLGFSHTIGFRNNYGLPFRPYAPIAEKQYTFWVHPLHIMDSSLIYYTKGTLSQKEKLIREFLAKHSKNCQIGVLWHNNYLFGEHLSMFERVLEIDGEFVHPEIL